MLNKIDFDSAQKLIFENTFELDFETVSLNDADGRVVYEDIFSEENIPPFARSPFDGYALIASDTSNAANDNPVSLRITEEIPAGSVAKKNIVSGSAAKILTGAPIPDGADLVIKYEDVDFDDRTITVYRPYAPGNICPEGEDIKKGTRIACKGQIISYALIGILAGLGITELKVYKIPEAALISTGSELLDVTEKLTPGKIRNSSVYTLRSLLSASHIKAEIKGIVKDSEEEICDSILRELKSHDTVITTGGVSVGDYDFIPRVVENLGADTLFWKIRMKPGGSILVARLDKKLIFCLSGNPAAAAVSMIMLVIPALKKAAGIKDYETPYCDAVLLESFGKQSPVFRFVPAKSILREKQILVSLPKMSGNGMLSPLDGADCIAAIPAGSGKKEQGDTIKIYFI